MNLYYIEDPLSAKELDEVKEMMGNGIKEVRVPYVLPTSDSNLSLEEQLRLDTDSAIKILKNAGIACDYGKRVALVIPSDMLHYAALIEAIAVTTGYYPFLVQTEQHRTSINNAGPLRIIDVDRLTRG